MHRKIYPMIDWEEEWQRAIEKLEERAIKRRDVSYWDERAEDYANYIKMSKYEHGFKIREVLEKEGIFKPNFEVLDIGAGPGSLTIPFAKVVKRVVAIEPSHEMCKRLEKNAKEEGVENITIINSKWEDIDTDRIGKFDLVICSNVCWMFKDIGNQLMRINKASKRFCCIAISASLKDERIYNGLFGRLGISENRIPYHLYLYNILYQKGILANMKIIDTLMRRSANSAIRHLELFLGTLKTLTERDKEIIRQYVMENSKNGVFMRRGKMAVIWWKREQ